MILSDWPTKAKIQARLHSDALVQALDDGDYAAALDATRRMRATADWVAKQLLPLVVTRDNRRDVLLAELSAVRQQWQHLAGAPRDRAALEREQARIVAQLREVAA